MPGKPEQQTILILSANPKGTQVLNLAKELSEIQDAKERAEQSRYFQLEYKPAASFIDMQRSLQKFRPEIFHFCGHGSGQAGLLLEGEVSQRERISTQGLANLFRFFRKKYPGCLECVLLNACYTTVQAEEVAKYIPIVIGMPQAIDDRAAREFVISFYDQLFSGSTIEEAFELGRITMEAYGVPDDELPQVVKSSVSNNQANSESIDTDNVIDVNASVETIQKPSSLLDLDSPEGVMNPNSPFYLLRPPEKKALQLVQERTVTLAIIGPPQTGKSSLLYKLAETAQSVGKQSIIVDFQKDFDATNLTDSESFFRQFCATLSDALDLEDRVDEYWQSSLSNARRCQRYLERYILTVIESPLFLAMDEVERIFDSGFRSDFFAMLRAWHSLRAIKEIWKKLDLAVALYSDPVMLIDELHQSPFNVANEIKLGDLSFAQLVELNHKHRSPFSDIQLKRLMDMLNGHPYLIRRALYLVARKDIDAEQLFLLAANDKGPFGSHLRLYLRRLDDNRELRQGFLQILRSQTYPSNPILFQLEGQGLVYRSGKKVLPRCQLYADYFKEHLYD